MNAELQPCVVITGASVGIGREFARLLAAERRCLLLVARNESALQAVAQDVGALGGTAHVLAIDAAAPGATARIEAFLAASGLYCDVLIANAGFGYLGQAIELGVGPQVAMIDLNVRALAEETLSFLPGMVERGRGGVLLVSSVASYLPGPNVTCYYATKAFVRSFGEALWQETRRKGVTVTTLCPGPTQTEFFKRSGVDRAQLFKLMPAMTAADVARAGWEGFIKGKRVVIPGLVAKLTVLVARLSPARLSLSVVGRMQRKG